MPQQEYDLTAKGRREVSKGEMDEYPLIQWNILSGLEEDPHISVYSIGYSERELKSSLETLERLGLLRKTSMRKE